MTCAGAVMERWANRLSMSDGWSGGVSPSLARHVGSPRHGGDCSSEHTASDELVGHVPAVLLALLAAPLLQMGCHPSHFFSTLLGGAGVGVSRANPGGWEDRGPRGARAQGGEGVSGEW